MPLSYVWCGIIIGIRGNSNFIRNRRRSKVLLVTCFTKWYLSEIHELYGKLHRCGLDLIPFFQVFSSSAVVFILLLLQHLSTTFEIFWKSTLTGFYGDGLKYASQVLWRKIVFVYLLHTGGRNFFTSYSHNLGPLLYKILENTKCMCNN